MMIRVLLSGLTGLVIIGLVALNLSPIGRIYLPSGTGIVAKQMCSMVFISQLDSDYAKSIYLDPLLGGSKPLIHVDVDQDRQEVSASVLGLFWQQNAVHREGLGCTLLHGAANFDRTLSLPPVQDFEPLPLDAVHRDQAFDIAALNAAIDAAFADPDSGPRHTLGVAVLHQGRLVADRYAETVSQDTPFLGWSMTKSATTTLAGVLVQDGEITLDTPPILTADMPDRSDITLEDLLRMSGGLALEERNNGMDPTSQMLFTQHDVAQFAATRARLHAPGDHWEYMSGNTNLASHTLQQYLGADLEEQLTAYRARVFEPLGIYSAIIEPDETGTLVGSSYMYATAHDWARLAQLYLNDGRIGDQQIVPDNWAEIVATPTEHSDGQYGLGFWLPLEHDGLPDGTYMMTGFQKQIAFIMPEQDLVVVRFGATNGVPSGSYELAASVAGALRTAAE